ncbi:hypothetical protein [Spartinivicinus poritis]|uniref:Uncharacterized protein n=1 Tax=Spartinivicinus poritis TaxID=2994640 RepID=A0ABT5UEY8_9GAMM|nr:hypothetical protein [Spartinivicinus sp. A2-2]MDE1464949.1 hypothetical protein [Spartinivicinus sp. A2-2]
MLRNISLNFLLIVKLPLVLVATLSFSAVSQAAKTCPYSTENNWGTWRSTSASYGCLHGLWIFDIGGKWVDSDGNEVDTVTLKMEAARRKNSNDSTNQIKLNGWVYSTGAALPSKHSNALNGTAFQIKELRYPFTQKKRYTVAFNVSGDGTMYLFDSCTGNYHMATVYETITREVKLSGYSEKGCNLTAYLYTTSQHTKILSYSMR